ncbi:hypothetical protein, partial [Paenibacillus xylanexedens]|uniref:hypothetical protein n=1 Tax=Paenibacillus xylanexedens TaxID=528191 RepID=UPI00119E9EC9
MVGVNELTGMSIEFKEGVERGGVIGGDRFEWRLRGRGIEIGYERWKNDREEEEEGEGYRCV